MIALNTPVSVSPLPFTVDFDSGIVTLGSCFADEVAQRLLDGGFRVDANPFGTLYNPASIAAALQRIIDDREVGAADLVEHDGLWHSWHHHGAFSRRSAEECLDACNGRLHEAHRHLRQARLLMVTFGTAWIYELRSEVGGQRSAASQDTSDLRLPTSAFHVVANCHKVPPQAFVRRMMDVDEIVQLWRPLLQQLSTFNPHLSVIFTVSPIRHLADGAHGNQLSKSTLLLAVEPLSTHMVSPSNHHSPLSTFYFPSYEIVLDELRDYRYYGQDMTHPTALAVDIVYERLQGAIMTPAVVQQAHLNAKRQRRDRHIPLHQS